jgi:hypothetical protein
VVAPPPAGSRPQPTATAAECQPGQSACELAAAVANFTEVTSFRATVTVEGPGRTPQQGTLEVVLPDKSHLLYSPGGDAPIIEMISLGSDIYSRAGSAWDKVSPGAAAPFDLEDINRILQQAAGARNVRHTSLFFADLKVACDAYAYSSGPDTTEVCVSSERLPMRVVASRSGLKTTIFFNDYNTSIDIRQPF